MRTPLRLGKRGKAVLWDALCMQRDEFAELQLTLEQDLVHSPLMQHLF